MKLIYPSWPKLPNQPEFHLPPHGPVCFAATVPDDVEIAFCDEDVDPLDTSDTPDLVALSCMLTCQLPRGWEIADHYRARGIPVICGGIATMLHAEEAARHADAVFLGETEGKFHEVIRDFKNGTLRRVYDHLHEYPEAALIGTARRDILHREAYNFRGVQMVDLVHASRGCRFNCFPCCTPFLGGRIFRPRPFEKVVEEIESIDNDRLFIVDNSLAQDTQWVKQLFREIAPLKRKWVSHPIKAEPEILDLAADAGCWYVYQAIVSISDVIRDRVRMLKERGIGVEGTVILGTDDQDETYIKRLVDFLLEIDLDLAEYTILTPFPHTPIRAQLEKEGRILHNDWIRYTGGQTVFRPAHMTPSQLDDMLQYAWDTFYSRSSKELKMGQLYLRVLGKETSDGTIASAQKLRGQRWGRQRTTPQKGSDRS